MPDGLNLNPSQGHGVLPLLQVEVLYEDEPLKEYYTLMDIAYIYPWRRVSRVEQWRMDGGRFGREPLQVWHWSVATVTTWATLL